MENRGPTPPNPDSAGSYVPGKRARYPGAGPFSEAQRDIFFGRERDQEALLRMLARHQQVVLYAKSGIGKSSLLQAGLLPHLRERGWTCLRVRFHAHAAHASSPLRRLMQVSPDPEMPEFLETLQGEGGSELWFRFKAHQIATGHPVLLVFDQFEELFTYPAAEIDTFKNELARLLYQTVPEDVRLRLRELDEQGRAPADDEFDKLFEPLNIKVVVALREDRLSHIHGLLDALPDLRHHWLEMKPLDAVQAREAIIHPAGLDGDFAVPPFRYTMEALDHLLAHLTRGHTVPVEATQLQIVCQKITAVREVLAAAGADEIGLHNLPDFHDILRNFYLDMLDEVPEPNRREVQIFIEEVMVCDGLRIPVAEPLCEQRIGRLPLQFLVRRHLLRAEPNSTGGFSYELSHDILVDPILEVKSSRNMDDAIEEQRLAQQRLELERDLAVIEQRRNRMRLRRTRGWFATVLILFLVSVILWFQSQATANYLRESENKLSQSHRKDSLMADSLALANSELRKSEAERRRFECRDMLLDGLNLLRVREYEKVSRCRDSAQKRGCEMEAWTAIEKEIKLHGQ